MYGDSNTWGFDPETGGRYAYEERWTTICADLLGPEFCCIPAGLNGRTTVFDDPLKGCRNGVHGLDLELQTHKPLDLCVVMLGTNDLKFTDAEGSARGMEQLLRMLLSANARYHLSYPVFPNGARILLAAPVLIRGKNSIGSAWNGVDMPTVSDMDFNDEEESKKISMLYQKLAEKYGLEFIDMSLIAEPSLTDGVHLSKEGHAQIGRAMADKIREIMCE